MQRDGYDAYVMRIPFEDKFKALMEDRVIPLPPKNVQTHVSQYY